MLYVQLLNLLFTVYSKTFQVILIFAHAFEYRFAKIRMLNYNVI